MDVIVEIDPKTLHWIRQEITESLDGVRSGLEAFADQGDTARLPLCVENLHRIRGAVEMVEITGATLLAHEMEETALALEQGRIEHKKDTVEVLMRGLLQLPAYLEHLYHGNKDVPLVLLPILNDLRAVQNKELLTEGAFFFTDLSVARPKLTADYSERPTWDSRTIAKKLRVGYLQGLLGYFRGTDAQKNLKILATVILNLEQSCTQMKAGQVWWVTAGVIHSLYDRGLESSVAVKILLGRVDRVIKRVVDGGEGALNCDPPNEIVKNLLYYVARSKSTAPRVLELKKVFKLEHSVPDAALMDQARADLIGFNANLMANVSEQIKEEMLRVKDGIDQAMLAGADAATTLEGVVQRLHSVGDALDMLGMQKLRKMVKQQTYVLDELMRAKRPLKDDDVMNIAGVLLYVESSMVDLNVQGSVELLQGAHSDPVHGVPEAEYRQLVKVAAQEALLEIAKVKDAVARINADAHATDSLNEMLDSMRAVYGMLAVIGQDSPARVMKQIEQYARAEWVEKRNAPDAAAQDLFANALVAVEYFIESLLEKAVAPEYGLELAERSLVALGYAPRRASRESATTVTRSAEAKPSITLVTQSPSPLTAPDVDHELISVFLAEADDELAAISGHLKRWKINRDDHESLNALMRSFHTLKGAGRIIGATSVGVLSWSIEEMLRRVLDGRVAAGTRMFGLLDDAVVALAELVRLIRSGEEGERTAPSVQSLIDLARELRQPAQAATS